MSFDKLLDENLRAVPPHKLNPMNNITGQELNKILDLQTATKKET